MVPTSNCQRPWPPSQHACLNYSNILPHPCMCHVSILELRRAVLLKKFVSSGIALCPGEPDPYEHVASVLTNVTRIKEVREKGGRDKVLVTRG